MDNSINEKREITAINLQIIVSVVSILAVIISILLLYNQSLEIQGKKTLFNTRETEKLSLFNRKLLLLIAIIFLIINYELYDISKEQGEDLKPYNLQIVASYLTVIAAIITLYVVLNPTNEGEISDVENPII